MSLQFDSIDKKTMAVLSRVEDKVETAYGCELHDVCVDSEADRYTYCDGYDVDSL